MKEKYKQALNRARILWSQAAEDEKAKYELIFPELKKEQWKPSKLQLQCLSDAVDAYHKQGYPAETLTSLLAELEEL